MNEFVVADSGIRQLHARFVDAVWRKDAEAFGECFSGDGEWKIAGMHMRGRAEIAEAIGRLLGVCEHVLITLGLPILEVDGNTATGRIYVTEHAKMVDGTSAFTIGIYYDRYVEEGGRWRFRHRHWSFQYRGPADLSAPFVGVADYGPFPSMPGPDEPTYVRKK